MQILSFKIRILVISSFSENRRVCRRELSNDIQHTQSQLTPKTHSVQTLNSIVCIFKEFNQKKYFLSSKLLCKLRYTIIVNFKRACNAQLTHCIITLVSLSIANVNVKKYKQLCNYLNYFILKNITIITLIHNKINLSITGNYILLFRSLNFFF